ncbi:MAG TPA: 2-C-methyl-D-erythritol 4-phosphate cytidylyltransferase [Dermatophilaceae bacterium]|nr:2-C-methyl-D-erythritol 4-phosphate cytidylyltransferase [Dermatophilaceae bacterium]
MLVAAGSGSRLGAPVPKAFVALAGRTLLDRSLGAVRASGCVDEVVLVVPAEVVAEVTCRYAASAHLSVVAGGAERTDSVAAGLAALGPGCEVVLVHDAARCLAPPELFRRVLAAVRAGADGVVPALPVVDTVKVVDPEGVVTGTADRAHLRAVQTPQGFRRAALEHAHASAASSATDDAALLEAAGHHVLTVPGDVRALKVTTPLDLLVAEALLRSATTHHP